MLYHPRVPVILESDDWALQLGEIGKDAATLMGAAGEGTLKFHRVAKAINFSRVYGKDLINPLGV